MAHLPTALTLAAATALAASTPPQGGVGAADPVPPVQALDVLLFEDSTAEFALGGFRERRRVTDAPDVEEVTALFSGLAFEVDARAPIVDLGDGSKDAFDRLDALRVDLEGAIGVVEMTRLDPLAMFVSASKRPVDPPGSSGNRSIPLLEFGLVSIAPRARSRGLAALLIAPPAEVAPFRLVNDLPGEITDPRGVKIDVLEALAGVPLLRIRRHEFDLIRERLRARRVRGADGKTETIRVGPGPVEAHVVVSRGADTEANRD